MRRKLWSNEEKESMVWTYWDEWWRKLAGYETVVFVCTWIKYPSL